MSEGLLTADQAASYLNISKKQLAHLTQAGSLRWINIGLGEKRPTRRYTRADLDEFIDARRRECQSTSDQARRHTLTTSSSGVVDFRGKLAQLRSGKQSASKTKSRNRSAPN
ncbi:MAG: DNA-binding protein [Martelella sp.]|uniref:helix-turn-helix domain-containing protein n=1 Tax=unclassified Martelella TaxID=2629616 RepID=UPI000C6A5B25|nr:helix-turn-helix domain-containing protein [Martelella sp.]MAU19183.1 DNA-binding protein [Martelella sp.]